MKRSLFLFIAVALVASIGVPRSVTATPPPYLRTIGSPGYDPGQLGLVTGVAIGSDGDVFVLDGAYVSRFHPDGTFVSRWDPCVGLVRPEQNAQGLESDRDGTIFVSTRGGGYPAVVREFDESGALLGQHDGLGDPWGMGYSSGYGLFIADGGRLWRLQTGQLTLLPNVSGCGSGELWGASSVAVVGNAVFETEYSERLQRLATGGAFVSELGSVAGCGAIRGYPRFIAPRDAGSVLVVDMLTNVVQIVGTSGAVLETWGGTGSTHGLFYGANCAAVGPDGLIYIADGWNGRVEVYGSGPTAVATSTWGQLKTRYH